MTSGTQQGKGGITEAYKDLGTYVKSFIVMYMPSVKCQYGEKNEGTPIRYWDTGT